MRSWLLPLLLLFTAGCPYASKGYFEEIWDSDEDGWPIGEDCNDENTAMYPYAADYRGDGCDADCGREPDADGDDWPDDADCNPDDASIYPCSPDEADGDSVDSDCDGKDSARPDGDCDYARDDPDYPGATPEISAGDCEPPAAD